jgi:hypothetical protein
MKPRFSLLVLLSFVATLLPLTADADLIGGAILEDTPTSFIAFVDHVTPTPAGRRSLNTGQFGFFGGRRGENWHVIFEETLGATTIFLDITAQHMVAAHSEDGGIGEEFSFSVAAAPGGPFESSDDLTGFPLRVDHGKHEDLFVRYEYGPCGLCPPIPGQSRLTITLEHVPEADSAFLLGFGVAGLVLWGVRRSSGRSAERSRAEIVRLELSRRGRPHCGMPTFARASRRAWSWRTSSA